jgi:hypothetical protein
MMHLFSTRRVVLAVIAACAFSSLFAETKKPVEGYSGAKWGSPIADVRKSVKGKIVFDDEKKIVVTRDGEITYRYGFVFKEKAPVKQEAPQTPQQPPQGQTPQAQTPQTQNPPAAQQTAPDASGGETKFFYTILEFPYITLDEIRKKMVAEYGEPTGDTINKEQGALIWDSGAGVAIAWVEAYEKKSYCRRISYISKTIAKELNAYQMSVFSRREIDVIKALVP